MLIKVYLLKAFGVDEKGGNLAGVVLDADSLDGSQKQRIAEEVGCSETAFVEKSDKADFKVSFFTPEKEVDLCGHATIAVYSLLFQKELIKSGQFTQELKVGVLKVEISEKGLVVMDQTLPVFDKEIAEEELALIFNIGKEVIMSTGLKPQIVSTGLRDILMPVVSREELFNLTPDFKAMTEFNKSTDTVGIHVFTLDTLERNAVAHCRNFAPLYGIIEESATGSSNGALVSYLYKNGKLENTDDILFEQGYSMQQPSHIYASLEIKDNEVSRVQVGGEAILSEEIEIDLK